MYGKIFASMYEGSIYGKWQAIVTFQQMIALADKNGVVDMTAQAIAARTSIPLEIIEKGILDLESPDPVSRTPDEEGRRIIRLDDHRPWGWIITNYKKYRDIRTAEERREYHRQYWHKRKEKQKTQQKLNNTQQTQPIVDTDTYAEVEVEVKPSCENKFSDEDYYAAEYLYKKIQQVIPGEKKPNFHKWADTIRLMRERDQLTHDEIRQVFDWANNDPFWNTNIRSPDKLRKQFPLLRAKMSSKNKNASQSTTEAHNQRVLDEILQKKGDTYDAE